MRWVKIARLAIAVSVVFFAVVVFMALRNNREPAVSPDSPRADPKAVTESRGISTFEQTENGRTVFVVTSQGSVTYKDGTQKHTTAVITLPDRDGRTLKASADELTLAVPPDKPGTLSTARMKGNVRLDSTDGLTVTAAQANYNDAEGMVKIPGDVEFARGRLKGRGFGATYDRTRDVIWLLDKAVIDIAADEKGQGAATATAKSAGLARGEHYVRLSGQANIAGDNRTIDADEIVIRLTDDDQQVKTMELRGRSRITGTGTGAVQSMSATDIDLAYGNDGRALESASLRENASVQLPGAGAAAGKTIAGRQIQIAMGPDGTTVTSLTATERVQVDLPAEAGAPARRIRAATLAAAGASGGGLETATFDGGVNYEETRAAERGEPAATRTARAQTLVVQTAPGLGAIQQADFRGNVRFIDGQTTADAPRALYRVAEDAIDLSPGNGDPGPEPQVNDGQVSVTGRAISLGLTSRKLEAETDVRSSLQPGRKTEGGKLPSMLKKEEPVSVTSNRLSYDGTAALAKYTGNVSLWQGQTSIKAEGIDVDDKTGNLTARGNVRTVMFFDDVDPKTKVRKPAQTTATGDTFVYEEAKRIAIYTTGPSAKAHINGPQGDVVGDRIRLFLKPDVNELERADSDGNVVVQEGIRKAKGTHLTYTAADETYRMTGNPVEVEEFTPPQCKRTIGATLTFRRAEDHVLVEGIPGVQPMQVKPFECSAERRD